jgi:hypothetical protein
MILRSFGRRPKTQNVPTILEPDSIAPTDGDLYVPSGRSEGRVTAGLLQVAAQIVLDQERKNGAGRELPELTKLAEGPKAKPRRGFLRRRPGAITIKL